MPGSSYKLSQDPYSDGDSSKEQRYKSTMQDSETQEMGDVAYKGTAGSAEGPDTQLLMVGTAQVVSTCLILILG